VPVADTDELVALPVTDPDIPEPVVEAETEEVEAEELAAVVTFELVLL
jgi:hypothetical protein